MVARWISGLTAKPRVKYRQIKAFYRKFSRIKVLTLKIRDTPEKKDGEVYIFTTKHSILPPAIRYLSVNTANIV